MDFDEWLDKQAKKYRFHTSIIERSSDFNHYQYEIIDPNHNALNFTLYLNSGKQPTLFTTDIFPLDHFNIAENYTSVQILQAAERCLEGNVEIRRSLTGGYVANFGSIEGKNEPDIILTGEKIEGFMNGFSKEGA